MELESQLKDEKKKSQRLRDLLKQSESQHQQLKDGLRNYLGDQFQNVTVKKLVKRSNPTIDEHPSTLFVKVESADESSENFNSEINDMCQGSESVDDEWIEEMTFEDEIKLEPDD